MQKVKNQLHAARMVYETYWDSYIRGDTEAFAATLDDTFEMIGTSETEVCHTKEDGIRFMRAQIQEVVGKAELRNRQIDVAPVDTLMLVSEQCDIYVLIDQDWNFYSKLRISSLLRETDEGWKMAQQHGSLPDMRVQDGETLAIEKIGKENLELRDAVKRATTELGYKNRELQIEAAVERVRAKSMGMYQTSDLYEVNEEVLNQLYKLKVDGLTGVSIYHVDECDIVTIWDLSSPGNMSIPNSYSIKYDAKKYPIMGEWVEIWKSSNQDYFDFDFPKEKLIKAIEEFKEIHPEMATNFKNAIESGKLKHQWSPAGRLSDGLLSIDLMNPPSEDTKTIVMKMAGAFNMAYQRFLDLQKAEAQAREAIKQASLDRVRGEIASMRTKDDLDRITPLIWKELNALGVPFIRCGVFIIDDETQNIHTFLSTPTGASIAAFHLPYDTPGNFGEIVSHWRLKQNYIHHWGETEFQNLAEVLLKNGSILTREQYLSSMPKEGIHLNFLPFLQGMLYVGNIAPLNHEDLLLVKSLASAFSTAYARYEDFRQLEEAKNQIEKTFTELKAAQAQLIQAEKMASLGELTAGIAHEIQNPLNFVNNFSEISNELIDELKSERIKAKARLNDEVGQGERDEALEDEILNDISQNLKKITHHGKRAADIVKGMLQHSRTSSGVKEQTDINELADEYLRLAYHGLRAKDKSFNADFKTDFDVTIGNINIIPQDIGRVLLNLINNAFYAVQVKTHGGASLQQTPSPYKPTVAVSTKNMATHVEIRVKDNGPGIPAEIKDKIFQPFFTTKPNGQGTGLGLSLSYDIVKAHGGELSVETKEGEGTEFIIEIPLKPN